MVMVKRTEVFDKWLRKLRDRQAVNRIQVRIDRLATGNTGDINTVGQGVLEMKINYGPGYRVYFLPQANRIIILLCGGDKTTQANDIAHALKIARKLKEK